MGWGIYRGANSAKGSRENLKWPFFPPASLHRGWPTRLPVSVWRRLHHGLPQVLGVLPGRLLPLLRPPPLARARRQQQRPPGRRRRQGEGRGPLFGRAGGPSFLEDGARPVLAGGPSAAPLRQGGALPVNSSLRSFSGSLFLAPFFCGLSLRAHRRRPDEALPVASFLESFSGALFLGPFF